MHSSFSSNDDDLFAPSSDSVKKEFSSFNKEETIDSLIKSAIDDNNVNATLIRARLAHAIYDTAHSFVFDTLNIDRTVFNTLNFLTNNMFSYNVYADRLEEIISKRIIMYDFITSINEARSNDLIGYISKNMDAQIDKFFLETYVTSVVEMFDFVIDYNIDIYKKVCLTISREPSLNVISRRVEDVDSSIVDSSEYVPGIMSNIRKGLGFEH